MPDLSQLTQDQIESRINSLPESLQRALSSERLRESVRRIGHDYELDDENIEALEQITAFVFLGFLPVSDLTDHISDVFEFEDSKTAQNIARDLNAGLFYSFRDQLQELKQLSRQSPPEQFLTQAVSRQTESFNCFYHYGQSAVGICNQCGKGACRDCIEDIGGALLCTSCIDVLKEEMEAGARAGEREKEISLQGVRSHLRWSWIIGCSCAVLALFVASPAQLSASVPQGQPSTVTLAFGLFLGSLVSGYIFWSMYWGIPAVWSWGRKLISSIGCFIVANPLAWVIILVFLFWVPLMLGAYYGVLGGAVYQYFKYRRRAEVELTRQKLILSAAFVGLLAVGSAVSVALAPNAIGPRKGLVDASGLNAKIAPIEGRIAKTTSEGGKQIIEKVQTLTSEVNGQVSTKTLAEMVYEFAKTKGAYNITPIEWEASQKKVRSSERTGKWKVAFRYQDYTKQLLTAEWEYDSVTNKVYPFEKNNAPQFWSNEGRQGQER